MINRELLAPKSIAVIGGSNNIHKPGGAIVRNLLQGGYEGTLRIVNPKENEVQGIKVFHDARELPPTELAVLVIVPLSSSRQALAKRPRRGLRWNSAFSTHASNMGLH